MVTLKEIEEAMVGAWREDNPLAATKQDMAVVAAAARCACLSASAASEASEKCLYKPKWCDWLSTDSSDSEPELWDWALQRR
jgi:hypothetical protein